MTTKKEIYLSLANDLIKLGNATVLFPRGGSMKPFIKDGEKIIVRSCAINEVRVADIVVFNAGSSLIAHRVMKVGDAAGAVTLITKGDSAYGLDAPVTAGNFLGRVISVEKGCGVLDLTDRRVERLSRAMLIYSRFMGNFIEIFAPVYLLFKRRRHRIKDYFYAVSYQALYYVFDLWIRSCVK